MVIDNEEYRPLVYRKMPTNYFVSETGKIYNVVTKHYLTTTIDNSGRYRVCISINGECYGVPVHTLTYLAFHGEIPDGMTINHIDEDYLNNAYTNLELVSRADNCKLYRKHNGLPVKKYSDMLITQVCEDLKSGMYYKDVAAAYDLPIQYVFNILKGKRRVFISKDFLPFPESAHCRKKIRKLPKKYICSLIEQNYTNDDILQLIGLSRDTATDKMFARYRKQLGHSAPEYFDKELISKVECLIQSGKCNYDIYAITGLEYNKRNANLIARLRQKLQILDFNPDGVSLDDQNMIITDILNGFSNKEICNKWGLERTEYIVNMLARLRQKAKKYSEGSSTIESIA